MVQERTSEFENISKETSKPEKQGEERMEKPEYPRTVGQPQNV
jgi:hypothetical protein